MPARHHTLADGRKVKMGRHRSPRRHPLRLHHYLRALPAPPASTDYWSRAASALGDIYLNDKLGCCVISCGYHLIAAWTGNAGSLFTASDAQITHDYSAIAGYVPGESWTDQGTDPQAALQYWTTTGFQNGSKLAGFIAIDASNVTLLKQAIDLFEGGLMLALDLPDSYLNIQGSGWTWDDVGAGNPANGHAVAGIDYNSTGIIIDTWGMKGPMTWRAVARYCSDAAQGEVYLGLSQAQIARGQAKAPNGLDWAAIVEDFDAMGGSITPVTPSPQPPPDPGPGPNPDPGPNPPGPGPGIGPYQVLYDLSSNTVTIGSGFTHHASILGAPLEVFPHRQLVVTPAGMKVSS